MLGDIGDQWFAQIPNAQWAPNMTLPIDAAHVAINGNGCMGSQKWKWMHR